MLSKQSLSFSLCVVSNCLLIKTDISIYVASVVRGHSTPRQVTQAREEYKESHGMERETASPETVAPHVHPRASPCPAGPFWFLNAGSLMLLTPHFSRT